MSRVLLKWAYVLARTPLDATKGRWARVSALLGRQALEDAMDKLWASTAPGVEEASARAQLLCLSAYTDEPLAERISYAYAGLSWACHHHPYELAPTTAEVNGWLDDVSDLIERVNPSVSAPEDDRA